MTQELLKLCDLHQGESGKIIEILMSCDIENRYRLLDLGFVRGAIITVENISPLKNPVAYGVKGATIALRNSEASKIIVEKVDYNEKQL